MTSKNASRSLLSLVIALGSLFFGAAGAPAQTFTSLHSFDGTDGLEPSAALVQGTDGNSYGTTFGDVVDGDGTVFKITPGGTLTTVQNFDHTDGANSAAALVLGTNGDFYGTTANGGANGYGTIFTLTPGGTLTALYSFCSQVNCSDGANPYAGLVEGTDGNFYGTTLAGGTNGDGTVFKITPQGTLTTLHSFDSTDGLELFTGLIQAADGNLYGTTFGGGVNGAGTVFRITPGGTFTPLYSFCSQVNCTDGANPEAGLLQASNGTFYGTTIAGGTNGDGTVFKITPQGTLTTLHSFDGSDGFEPFGLVQATDGRFYGTTFYGGANNSCSVGCGTVFKITPSGTLTTLHSFDGTDGEQPLAGLLQATNGTFYGTTFGGGASGDGTVFGLSVGLGPFVETVPTSGKVGAAVKILGTNLTGATSVTFNGTAATFTVKSPSLITTTVPTGATSGIVQVVTPTRTLSSNVRFRVLP